MANRELWANTSKTIHQKLLETMYERNAFETALDNIKKLIRESGEPVRIEILEIIDQAKQNASESEKIMK
ncbi:MAG: hypothetical protein ACRC6M_18070 [Microcystaceae cyanobacterium]